ncbi:MAG: hypothetical protein R3F65_14485 [bacterium]|nr:hypothetical protein [Myxococcales bacterium]
MADADDVVGQVVKVLARGRLVVDVGLREGVRVGDVFAIFEAGEEVLHPATGESLGVLERVKAHLVAEHVQPRLTQLGSPPETGRGGGDRRVLSAVLAETSAAPRGVEFEQRGRAPQVGDGARRVAR